MKGHREYKIDTKWNKDIKGDGDLSSSVTRRYSHFESLREKLLKKYPFEAIPILPEKDWLIRFSTDNSQQVKDRMNKLQYFLTIIVINPVLNATQEVCDFLIDTDEHFFDSEFQEENNTNIYEKTKGRNKFRSILKNFRVDFKI